MTNGFIKLHRKMTDWEWYKDANTFRLFVHLLFNANWEDSRYQGHKIPRGSLVIGRKQLALELGMSEQSVRTSLTKLKSTNEITTKSTNKFTVVNIVKYNDYQEFEIPNRPATQPTTQPTTNQQLTTSKEIKKERIEEKKNNKKEISLVLPPEFQTTVFGDAWAKWVSYRKNIRHALVQETAEGQIKKLTKMSGGSDTVAAAIIEQSIDHGWQGLFELKENAKKTVSTRDLFSEIDEALHDN